MSARPELAWRYKCQDIRVRLEKHEHKSDAHGSLSWWEGYAVGPQGMVAIYAQHDEKDTFVGSFAQFRIVRHGVEFCYRRAWDTPVNRRAVALAAGQVLRGEVAPSARPEEK